MEAYGVPSNYSSHSGIYQKSDMFKDMFVNCIGELCNSMTCPDGYYVAANHYRPSWPILCLPNGVVNGSQLYERLQNANGSNYVVYIIVGIFVAILLCCCFVICKFNKKKSASTGSITSHQRRLHLPRGPVVSSIPKSSRHRPFSIASNNLPNLTGAYDIESQPTFDPAPPMDVEEQNDLEIKCRTPLGRFEFFK